MNEKERNEKIDELGHEVAALFPEQNGSVTFDFSGGKYRGLRELKQAGGAVVDLKRRPVNS